MITLCKMEKQMDRRHLSECRKPDSQPGVSLHSAQRLGMGYTGGFWNQRVRAGMQSKIRKPDELWK